MDNPEKLMWINKIQEEQIKELQLELNSLNMLIDDIYSENQDLRKKLPKTFKEKFTDIMLYIFGNLYEEDNTGIKK